MKIENDVVIIGGGIAGLSLAKLLEKSGINYALVEKNPTIGKYGNRIINNSVFKKIGIKQSDIIRRIDNINFYSPSEIKLTKKSKGRGFVVNLKTLENRIFESIQNKNKIFMGTQANRVDFSKNLIKCKSSTFKSKIIILASGCKENIVKGNTNNCICFTREINGDDVSTVVLDNKYTHGFYGWIIPLSDGKIEIGFGTDKIGSTTAHSIRETLHSIPYIKKYKNEIPIRELGGFIPTSIIKNRCGKSHLIIGDCSGGEPMLGGSIHKCIDESEIAHCVIKDNLDNGTPLKFYDTIFNKRIGDDIEKQQKLRDLLNNVCNSDIDETFKSLQGSKIDGGGLVNELFKNIIKNLSDKS